ncbi:hypothetical protein V6N12_074822 [Hibiscus sabdariffa]|uniref:Uncharacterized protein n=1 Tax=Hibiscus sabdariffa TaxID=183260 RepID=A0ABR2D2I7_9ROSI
MVLSSLFKSKTSEIEEHFSLRNNRHRIEDPSCAKRRRLARLMPRAKATEGTCIMYIASPRPSDASSSTPRSPHASGVP